MRALNIDNEVDLWGSVEKATLLLNKMWTVLNAGTFNECQLAWQAGDCWTLSIKSLCIIIFSDNTVGEWFSKLSCLMHENSRNCHTYFVLDLVHIIYL